MYKISLNDQVSNKPTCFLRAFLAAFFSFAVIAGFFFVSLLLFLWS
jgi:hypothetical protein